MRRKPSLGIDGMLTSRLPGHAERTMRVSRLGEDAAVMAAAGEHKSNFCVGQKVELEHRMPRRDVIALGAEHEERLLYVEEGDWPAADLETAFCEIVIEE